LITDTHLGSGQWWDRGEHTILQKRGKTELRDFRHPLFRWAISNDYRTSEQYIMAGQL
jgi:hypothetical protein